MADRNFITSIESALKEANSFLIVLAPKINFDGAAAGLGLYLALEKAGKDVKIISPEPMTVKFSPLVGVNKVSDKLEGRNLVVSFDYTEDSIEKVSYQIENGKFNLMIQPKEGYKPLSTEKVDYSYSGAKADAVFILGFTDFNDLGPLYKDNQPLFEQEKVFRFNYNPAISYSEQITGIISQLQMPVSVDMANNLILGIERATRGFDPALSNADTFEAAAFCLRWGAQRQKRSNTLPEPKKETQELKPEPEEQLKSNISGESTTEEQTAPADWLEPKIFKSNTKV